MTDSPTAPPSATPSTPTDQHTWSGRFGWILGASAGLLMGFTLTWLIELYLLKGRVIDPTAFATRLSSVIVPACFITGALTGHALGLRAGSSRYRLLGSAAGVALAALLWATVVISR